MILWWLFPLAWSLWGRARGEKSSTDGQLRCSEKNGVDLRCIVHGSAEPRDIRLGRPDSGG